MFDYPNKIQNIFDKLLKFDIKPIIIGGFVRDFFLNIDSKDIDVELYGLDSFEKLEEILEEFGSVNSVGKSFGVCKLSAYGLDIDFSFPRLDSKISSGHKGFKVTTDSKLDFKTATSRRDFTINAIGYDVQQKTILDPYNGLKDLKLGILRAVDLDKFAEDPLRVMRAAQFSARFDFRLDSSLFNLSQKMIQKKLLQELPQERIFEELKKALFKARKPSLALVVLQQLGAIQKFSDFELLLKNFDFIATKELTHKQLSKTLTALVAIINGDTTQAKVLSQIVKNLQKVKPFLQGRDLIQIGLKPSKEFSNILNEVYTMQVEGELQSKEEALSWLHKFYAKCDLNTFSKT